MCGESIGAITFDFSDLEMSRSRSHRFQSLISHKRTESGYMLLLNINKKACVGTEVTFLV